MREKTRPEPPALLDRYSPGTWSAEGFACTGCCPQENSRIQSTDGVFIYHSSNAQDKGWGGYVSHLNPVCIVNMFVHYIHSRGFDALAVSIMLDAAVRSLREKGSSAP